MKSYTNIEQSNELAEILPIESADMSYSLDFDSEKYEVTTTTYKNWVIPKYAQTYKGFSQAIPCWSLATLLNVLPNGTDVVKEEADTENERYMCTVGINDDIISTFADNPVDACYKMIIKLHELKML